MCSQQFFGPAIVVNPSAIKAAVRSTKADVAEEKRAQLFWPDEVPVPVTTKNQELHSAFC